ncbi:MAG: UDP-N-acetylmuramoyl-tripeptide--D-alanyl-D-alanine ligase [Candidatus Magasanikbacteria bacterium]|jgi:UDP-N-acetylmuramoyl-tripeptide--D-alanyl-D-alanine ligase|nr:UDP-N-acetylmuramoyl-tripeptide--D-alanyl-D-alanine ligase [Candidatus Magasanikbacteria bacterium]MBT4071805.1 UDP-N-acetylmuramoyl-tripeptide--D-alanyl-D-alanine ligase [Candidatus Magasanikbacteria bacterium]
MYYPSLFNIIIALLWFITASIDIGGHTYYWQLKWYRIDRFKDFLSTIQGKQYIFSYPIFWRTLLVLLISFFPIHNIKLLKEIIVFLFLADIVRIGYLYLHKRLRRPQSSIKAMLIVLLSLSVEALLLIYTRYWAILLFALVLRPIVVSIFVIGINKMTDTLKKWYFIRAEKKLKKYKNLTVIGITGSYGKTTVKEFLSHIVSKKFRVIKTPRNINSDIGISRFILETDFSEADIFIVEIGAYNKGDVQLICDIVHPTIGILTAINEQHLSLFGSMKNIQDAKYELLRAIPKSGVAITNADNPYCMEYIDELEAKVMTFGIETTHNPTCVIRDIKHREHEILSVDIKLKTGKRELIDFYPKITGRHNALNIAPCLLAADCVGMTKKEMVDATNDLRDPKTAIHTYSYGKTTIIDDSYNSNPHGFRAALDVLASYPTKKRRIVVTRGMLELGAKSDELHAQIGGEIAFVTDELVIITDDFIESLTQGVVEKYKTTVLEKTDPEALLAYIKDQKDTNSVILLENRIPAIIHQELDKHKKNSTT